MLKMYFEWQNMSKVYVQVQVHVWCQAKGKNTLLSTRTYKSNR